MRLLLIRHGQTQSNIDRLLDTAFPGAPLTEEGHRQAGTMASALSEEPIEAVFASPLTRAQQTAAPLAEAHGLQVETLEGVEEISAGVAEMSPDWTSYVALLESWSPDNLDAKLEGGESAREFMTRFTDAVARVAERGHEQAAIVSHGAALRVWAATQDPATATQVSRPLLNTEWIALDGSATDGWRIAAWGQPDAPREALAALT
ncbi:MAG: histidine phosphatase family protein [Arachnia sp.]